MNWKAFREGHPQLGMVIEVQAGDKIYELGKVKSLEDAGSWICITTDKFVNVAVRLGYEWREHEQRLPTKLERIQAKIQAAVKVTEYERTK